MTACLRIRRCVAALLVVVFFFRGATILRTVFVTLRLPSVGFLSRFFFSPVPLRWLFFSFFCPIFGEWTGVIWIGDFQNFGAWVRS
ncbi:hypothetical protein QBC47DRAFT_371334 [Echria macrotheca]|uniref:Uncharacterized protein n=1 Tax=Echria macrotheca TaxID=438768 RepID=A0AAJ0FEW8_9PEZI|nr:hypothetical protein QBC47DRAFT_371334 [Echria macrotheca]